MDINTLDNIVNSCEKFYISKKSECDLLNSQYQAINEEIEEIDQYVLTLEKVSVLLKKVAEYARNQARLNIESLVSNCLKYIFNENIDFKIDIKDTKKSLSAEFFLETYIDDVLMRTKPEISNGGGVIDIISIALRISFLQLHSPLIEGPLILDEPAKHVSNNYIFNVGDFLKKSAERFDRQIIMVTHNEQLAEMADTKFQISLNGNITEIELIEN
ncbi:MAG: ATPase [Tissierellia bacterium]|nr:ATPase [Tissierellia bacterium]